MIPVLQTARLFLRGWREGDFEAFAALHADPEQARFIGGVLTRNDAWRRMASIAGHWILRGYGTWALEDRATGEFVGWSGLWEPEGLPGCDLGWTLAPTARGRGLAQEAALRGRRYAYETVGLKSLISLIHPLNAASIRVAEKLGAHFERITSFGGADYAMYRHPPAETFDPTSNQHHQKELESCP
jgi:RimJ/RimL family protein N-acetyltransferase